jgi:glycosyltransferase involved in cell wall biosynthesis
MKIHIIFVQENWIIDRLGRKWKEKNKSLLSNIEDCDIIWCMHRDELFKIPEKYLNKKIITSIYHLVPSKINSKKIKQFKFINKHTNLFHSMCTKTEIEMKNYFTKPIKTVNFWNDTNLWFEIKDKNKLRKKYKIDNNSFIIGSFQRDTEGKGIKKNKFLPKLEKGPDIFVKSIIILKKKYKNIKVLLAGWRRQYVMKELKKNNIKFYYFERPNLKILNELYNCLDLYIIGSRTEGGPRAINECALTKTPLFSTDVGCSDTICHPDSIFNINNIKSILNCKYNIEFNYQKALSYSVENYMDKFNKQLFNNSIISN